MNNFRINHLAVWVSIIVMHAIGFLWYGILFAKQWMAMVGLDDASMQEDSGDFGPWIMNAVPLLLQFTFWHGCLQGSEPPAYTLLV